MSTQTKTETPETWSDTGEIHDVASRNDITSGGIIGAVGGGIVGALAGGPVGAVIGAVVGGGASAAAVEYVDHHDHPAETLETGPAVTLDYREGTRESDYDGADYAGTFAPVDRVFVVDEYLEIDLTETIRVRAYQLWEERGRREGFADEDWIAAEIEVFSETTAALTSVDENVQLLV